MPRSEREGVTTFLLRDIDNRLWSRVKRQLTRDARQWRASGGGRLSLRDVVLSALEAYASGAIEVRRHE